MMDKNKIEKKRKDRLTGMPVSFRRTYKKATLGGLRAAINAQCAECCGYDRLSVRECTDCGCPLYVVRPYQTSDEEPEAEETTTTTEE